MKKILGLVLVAALAFAATGCSSGASAGGGTSTGSSTGALTIPITQADQGKPIAAKVGDTLVVSLEGNPSTGYTWVARDLPSFLTQDGEPTFTATGGRGAVGAPGMLSVKFKANAAGSGDLVLDYARPWETTATPAKTFSVTVGVK